MSKITINTVQGIGDIFWCYQKLAPYFDIININVLYLEATAIQLRAKAFCHMLPKVGTVCYVKVSAPEYKRVTRTRFNLPDGKTPIVDYAVNAPLEQGINLRELDQDSRIEEFVDLGLPKTVEQEDYLCAFVSGTQNSMVWNPDKWIEAINQTALYVSASRIVLIGADWDKNVEGQVIAGLRDSFEIISHVGAYELADSVDVIRKSKFFLGFQSGLNVIAENYDVPQLMLYYKHLEPMLYTWCKPENVKTKFTAATFSDDFAKVLAGVMLGELV